VVIATEGDFLMDFCLKATDGFARRGTLSLAHGTLKPRFHASWHLWHSEGDVAYRVKRNWRPDCARQYFPSMASPGLDVIEAHGGLHGFMGWDGPILTDSGGFQVFSLGALRKITEEGVRFQSPVNGDKCFLTPEESIRIQKVLNSDIVMIFDECTPYPADENRAADSMHLSLRWAERSKHAHEGNTNALFVLCRAACSRVCAMNRYVSW